MPTQVLIPGPESPAPRGAVESHGTPNTWQKLQIHTHTHKTQWHTAALTCAPPISKLVLLFYKIVGSLKSIVSETLRFRKSFSSCCQAALINSWAFTSCLTFSLCARNHLSAARSQLFLRIYTKRLNRLSAFFFSLFSVSLWAVPHGLDSCVWPASLLTFDLFMRALNLCFSSPSHR